MCSLVYRMYCLIYLSIVFIFFIILIVCGGSLGLFFVLSIIVDCVVDDLDLADIGGELVVFGDVVVVFCVLYIEMDLGLIDSG